MCHSVHGLSGVPHDPIRAISPGGIQLQLQFPDPRSWGLANSNGVPFWFQCWIRKLHLLGGYP